MKTVIIVQARMGSTRLPGKILKEILGKPLLFYLVERLRRCKLADELVIATTLEPQDDVIVAFCRSHGISYFRGSSHDVLSRYYLAAQSFFATTVVRITSDCPLIDPQMIDSLIQLFHENLASCDYLTNTLIRTFPRGMDIEIFSRAALEEAALHATHPSEREHVTAYFYNHPERYRLKNVTNDEDLSRYRWTVDTLDDFLLIREIFERLYQINPYFNFHDIVNLVKAHPALEAMNRHIQQKKV